MSFFKFDQKILNISEKALSLCEKPFAKVDGICQHNSEKILSAFIKNQVSDSHLKGTTGYGYGDMGRDTLDEVYAQVLGAESAYVRHSFASGTHTITTALFGVLRTGDTVVSITGTPYDTLQETLKGSGNGSLKDYGIFYKEVPLLPSGEVDFDEVSKAVIGCKIAYIQRSRGYSLRASFTVAQIEEMVKVVRKANPSAIIMVDNCYGEFVEKVEPISVGADIIMGSLIKNPGGGIAETGGYIAGRKDLVEQCACRHTSPGTGSEVGCSLNQLRGMYLGLFHAPSAVQGAVKTAIFASALFQLMGYEALPQYDEFRTDIIALIKLGGQQELIAFCEGIQMGSPIDSFATPIPSEMPGYDNQVIMAAGAFTMGASIELSADAPLREPYAVFLQGGLTFETGKVGVLSAAQRMLDKGLLNL